MYNDVTRLESHVYFYGLRKGEETYLKIGEGKELLIKYLEQSDPDENGIRTLSFQVNGSIRTVKIQDHNLEIKTDRRLKADKNNPQHLGSSIPGTVDKVLVKEGDVVTKNMPLMTIEAMKMETTVVSIVNGTVDKIYVEAGDSVHQDDLLVSFHIKEWFPCSKFTVVGQYGTHIDAPIHFVEGGRWLDEIDLKDLLLPLYVIDKSKEVAANPNFILSKQDILDFEAEHGKITEGAFVAFRSDWSKRWQIKMLCATLMKMGFNKVQGGAVKL
mgnify:CR=1 FL=1